MRLIEVPITIEWEGEPFKTRATRWLDPSARPTDDRAQALVLSFKTTTTMVEDFQTETRLDDLNGGLGQTIDIQRGVDSIMRAIRLQLEHRWHHANPTEEGLEPATPPDAAIEALYAEMVQNPDDPLHRDFDAYLRLLNLQDRMRLAAAWPALIQNPPPTWEDIAHREMVGSRRNQIVTCVMHALDRAREGNG